MRMTLIAGVLLFGLTRMGRIQAQRGEPNLPAEVAAVRAEIARSTAALRHYTWLEHIEVLVKGDVKSSSDLLCRYDSSGQFTRTPVGAGQAEEAAKAVSKRPTVRAKADLQDYIERAITLMYNYVPPKPEEIDSLLEKGYASLGRAEAGRSEVRFKYYFQEGDLMIFTYDSASKVLQAMTIDSTLGKSKDPVTLKAGFETLPDGVNHFSSAILEAKKRGVQVKMRNDHYQKTAD